VAGSITTCKQALPFKSASAQCESVGSWQVATLLPEEVRKCGEALAQSQTFSEASADFCLLLAGSGGTGQKGAEWGRAGRRPRVFGGWDGRLIPVAAIPLAGRPEGNESSVLSLSLSLSPSL